jgi:hypothetical protein
MPPEHHDSRTSERIEAFLDGPPRPVRRRARNGVRRPHHPVALESVLDWRDALNREEIRVARYGRPATVMIVEVGAHRSPEPLSVVSDLVGPVLEAIRHEARETDHVVRTSATRFQLLLPETGAADAGHFAERLRDACGERLNGHGAALHLRVEMVTPGHGMSLADALDATERRLAG